MPVKKVQTGRRTYLVHLSAPTQPRLEENSNTRTDMTKYALAKSPENTFHAFGPTQKPAIAPSLPQALGGLARASGNCPSSLELCSEPCGCSKPKTNTTRPAQKPQAPALLFSVECSFADLTTGQPNRAEIENTYCILAATGQVLRQHTLSNQQTQRQVNLGARHQKKYKKSEAASNAARDNSARKQKNNPTVTKKTAQK